MDQIGAYESMILLTLLLIKERLVLVEYSCTLTLQMLIMYVMEFENGSGDITFGCSSIMLYKP